MMNVFEHLENGLIVSCQASNNDPFNSPEAVTMFAKAAIDGGAIGIRTEGFEKTKMIVDSITKPVIGLIKSVFPDGFVRITGSFNDVELLIKTRCHLIAVDGTFRQRENLSGPEFISKIKKRYDCIVMADISTFNEGIECADAGADCISTTLSGYTPETINYPKDKPDFRLVETLIKHLSIPVIAEGKINKPSYAKKMIKLGAWAVVVGTAITRPKTITSWFVEAMSS
jgi:N-acylglucosamine-6-phosphate 2-epimerase